MSYNTIAVKNKYSTGIERSIKFPENSVLNRYFGNSKSKQVNLIYSDGNCQAYEVWNAKKTVSKVVIVMENKNSDSNIAITNQFGNVDILLLSEGNNSLPQESKKLENDLTPTILGYTSKFLSNGQLLNLSTFGHFFQDADLSSLPVSERIYFENYQEHKKTLKNKKLIDLPIDATKPVLHFTDFKQPIVQSGEVRVSRSGCLGSAVYCTSLVGEKEDALSGFAWGLNNRKVVAKEGETPDFTPSSNKFLGVSLKDGGNEKTNWFNRFGYGPLYLEASTREHNEILKTKDAKKIQTYNQITSNCVEAYGALYEFIQPILNLLNSNQNDIDFEQELEKIYTNYELAQSGSAKIFLNNLIFDIIKDYILILDNKNQPSDFINHDDSFDMHKQYEIVFNLTPSMKTNWNTVNFCPSMQKLQETLLGHGYPLNDKQGHKDFAKFLVQNLYFYLGKVVLNGNTTLPEPSSIKNFDDLAKKAPGLAGVMWHFYGAEITRGRDFFDKYLTKLRECEFESNTSNGIVYSVKCGMYRTEEIGIYKNAQVNFFEPTFAKNEELGHYVINQAELTSSLTISACPSDTNGMTVRASEPTPEAKKATTAASNPYRLFAPIQNSTLRNPVAKQSEKKAIKIQEGPHSKPFKI